MILTGSSEFTKHRSITMKAELQKTDLMFWHQTVENKFKTPIAKHRRLHTEKGVNSLRIPAPLKLYYFLFLSIP